MSFGFRKSKLDGKEKIFGVDNNVSLPEKYEYNEVLPRVVDQGSNPICVPCSISAYVNWKLNLKDGSHDDNKMDYFSVYRYRSNDGEGMSFKDAFKFISEKGVKTTRGNFKIDDYALVRSVIPLKKAIVANGPCVGALPVYSTDLDDFWKKDGYHFDIIGYHAIAIVGYNTKGFIIRNSWGSSYGKKGYFVIPYKDFGSFVEIWTIL